MGLGSEPLRRGYDCPLYATYVNALVNWGQSGPVTLSDAMCVVSHHPQHLNNPDVQAH